MKRLLECKIYNDELNEAVELLGTLRGELVQKTLMVTGASGVIGRELVDIIMHENATNHSRIKVIAVGRDKVKLNEVFKEYRACENYESWDYSDVENNKLTQIDYIVHLASPTASKMFVEQPIEVLLESVKLTKLMLDCATNVNATRFMYVSSVEAYGDPYDYQKSFTECDCGKIDTTSARSSYPIAKNVCEMLTSAYIAEKNLAAVIVRPGKVYGLTFPSNDNRIFVDFALKATRGEDIILHSDGKQAFSGCYCMDAALAILYVLIKGKIGDIYNIANENSTTTVKELADIFCKICQVKVVIKVKSDMGYTDIKHAILDTKKLKALGFCANIDLPEGVERLINVIKEKAKI